MKPFARLVMPLGCLLCSSGLAVAAASAPPDREMLRMMDVLREMEMIKQIDMLKDMQNLERGDSPTKITPARKSAPAKPKEETAK